MTTREPTLTHTPSVRDRLLLAFADLSSYGIATRAAVPGTPLSVRSELARELREGNPHSMCCYAFWTSSDDRCFDRYGGIAEPLPIHTSGTDVSDAVLAVLWRQGIAADAVRIVHPARQR